MAKIAVPANVTGLAKEVKPMRLYFTRRHADALKSGKLKPSLPFKLRVAIRRILQRYSEPGTSDATGEFVQNPTFMEAEETLKDFYGEDELVAYGPEGKLEPTDLGGLIESGYPARVLDALEAWMDCAPPDRARRCEADLNSAFEIHQSPWRIVGGTVFLIDSEYLHTEVIATTQSLLKECGFAGPLEEFQTAVSLLMSGQTKEAVVNAHKSVESVMKAILGTREHLTFGALLRQLIESGIIPDYYEEFFAHFEKLALGAVKQRNLPGGGHGQGADLVQIPRTLAELAVNLAGAINVFLIKTWINRQSGRPRVEQGSEQDRDPGL